MSSTFSPSKSESSTDERWIRQALDHVNITGLILVCIIIGCMVSVLQTTLIPNAVWSNVVAHVLLEVCGVLIAVGVVYCLWVHYRVSPEHWVLMATVTFSGLALGQLAHALTSIGLSISLQGIGIKYYYAWRITAYVLLAIAAGATSVVGRQHSRSTGLHALSSILGGSIILAGIVLGISRSWHRVEHTFPNGARFIESAMHWCSTNVILAHAALLIALLAAFMAFAKRYVENEDVFSIGIARYLFLAATGEAVSLMSAGIYGTAWWASHIMGITGLFVLIVGLAIEFGASYADSQRRVEHLEAVHHMCSHLSDTLDLRVVLLALVSDTSKMLSARFASVMLADEEGDTLSTVATYGLHDDPIKLGEPQKLDGSGRPEFYAGHTARAFKERRICTVADVYTDVEFIPWSLLARHDGYTVSVPLVYQDVPLGVMNLFFERHVPLSDERVRLFKTLASSASVAIANAQLYERILDVESGGLDDGIMRFKLAS